MKTHQDILKMIAEATLSPEREARVKALITHLPAEAEVDAETIEDIKDIIQEELEDGMADILTPEDTAEIAALEQTMLNEIKEIEKDVNTDVAFVESELEELEKMAEELSPAIDQANVDRVKEELKSASSL